MLSLSHRAIRPLLLAFLLGSPALAEQDPVPPKAAALDPAQQVAAELIRLNDTLMRLEALLERQLEGKKVELTLKRVESVTRRLEGMEGQLAKVRDRRRGQEEGLATLLQEIQQVQVQLDDGSMEVANPHIQTFHRIMEERIREHKERIAQSEAEIAELEAQRDSLQREVIDWQDYIDRQINDF